MNGKNNIMDKIECINDSNKPADFPSNLWVKRGRTYTIDRIDKMNMQGGRLGVMLKEIDTSNNFPYTHFDLSRFRPVDQVPENELVEELVESY